MTEDTHIPLESRYNDQIHLPPKVQTALPILAIPSIAEPSAQARRHAWRIVLYTVLIVLIGTSIGLGVLLLRW